MSKKFVPALLLYILIGVITTTLQIKSVPDITKIVHIPSMLLEPTNRTNITATTIEPQSETSPMAVTQAMNTTQNTPITAAIDPSALPKIHGTARDTKVPLNVAIVYSGPTAVYAGPKDPRSRSQRLRSKLRKRTKRGAVPGASDGIYDTNFRHFLRHGLPSSHHGCTEGGTAAVIIVLTAETAAFYRNLTAAANARCGEVEVVVRENRCLDMESARVGLARVDWRRHEKVVFINCGMFGPILRKPFGRNEYWAVRYMNGVDEETKLVGITINCGGKLDITHAHVQSMIFSTDETGYKELVASEAIFDCTKKWGERDEIIVNYEMGMSRDLMNAGYSIMGLYDYRKKKENSAEFYVKYNRMNASAAECEDQWHPRSMKFSLYELVFFKNTRFKPKGFDEIVRTMDM